MNSIFGIGVLEFIFILIFALIFLGPERLPSVTRQTLEFLGKLRKLSGDLTRQVNEEIGDLRELDPSYHMKELMGDDDEKEKGEAAKSSGKSAAAAGQTSAPSQPQVGQEDGEKADAAEEKTIAPPPTATADAPKTAAASANGRRQGDGGAPAKPKSAPARIPSAPKTSPSKAAGPGSATSPRSANNRPKRGVKTLAELRKQRQAKRKTGAAAASNSTYLDERNKRAQRRADERREALAAQKAEREEAPGIHADEAVAHLSGGEGRAAARDNGAGVSTGAPSEGGLAPAHDDGAEAEGSPLAAVNESPDGEVTDGTEETAA